ncbi:MAG: hypothetical protein WBE38_10570 [Terracidiphilus sp.]
MDEEVQRLLDDLKEELRPIRDQAERFLSDGNCIDPASQAVLISPRPKIGVEAYAIVLFPGVDSAQISHYEQTHKVGKSDFVISDLYKRTLESVNGAELFQISLFGVPGTMRNSSPLLSRSTRQPLDLATANQNWATGFKPRAGQFHFGGGPYSFDENLGYFLNPDESVEAHRKGGEIFQLWPSITEFLEDELARAEALFPEHESRWKALLKEIPSKKRRR